MKLAEMRGEHEVDSDQEERNGLAQDRMRLKKNISVTGNYQMTKVSPAGGAGANGGAIEGKETAEGKNRSTSVGGKAQAINNVEKMKKNNLTASNPIIGAPLGSQIAKKSEKFLGTNVQIKSKDPNLKQSLGMNNSAMVKPALANTKIPKYIKKSLKFAKGVDGGESPGRNSAADQ